MIEAVDTPLARELLDARVIANLASFRTDGTIHLVAMWFAGDGAHVLFPTNSASAKAKNLRRDPRATVMTTTHAAALMSPGSRSPGASTSSKARRRELNEAVHLRYITAHGLALPEVGGLLEGDDVTLQLVPERASSWDMRQLPGGELLRQYGAFVPLAPTLQR